MKIAILRNNTLRFLVYLIRNVIRSMKPLHRRVNKMLFLWTFKENLLDYEKKELKFLERIKFRKAPFFIIIALIIILVIMTIAYFTEFKSIGLLLSLIVFIFGCTVELEVGMMIKDKEVPKFNLNEFELPCPMNPFNTHFL